MALTVTVPAQAPPSTLRSTLDPNAPAFIPMSYRAVEDFSDEWWNLVRSSPSFRDYWLQDYCSFDSDLVIPADLDSFFLANFDLDDNNHHQEVGEEEEERGKMDLIRMGWLDWEGKNLRRGGTIKGGSKREKAPKIVAVKVSPRMIHQPR